MRPKDFVSLLRNIVPGGNGLIWRPDLRTHQVLAKCRAADFNSLWCVCHPRAGVGSSGLCSVVSNTVVQRTSELGVRLALGARRGDVLGLVGLSAGTSVGIGLLVGLGRSFGLTSTIARWIENGTRDPMVVLLVSAILMCVAAVACLRVALLPSIQ